MAMRSFKLAFPFAGLQGTVFLTLGIYLPFWPVWLESRGLSPAEIGFLLAVASWTRIATTPVIANLADRSGRTKSLVIWLVIVTFAAFALHLPAEGLWPLLILHLIATTTFYPQLPLADAMTMSAVTRHNLNYGRIRLWGSATFILGSLTAGALLDLFTADSILYFILATVGLNFLAAAFLPRAEPRKSDSTHRIWPLLRDRRILLFLVLVGLLQGSHSVYYAFSAIHWQAAGLDGNAVGWLWAEGVIAEIVLFAFAGRWAGSGDPRILLVLAALGGIARWTLYATTADLGVLVAGQVLHALTFGATHLATMNFINRHAPEGLHASTQSLFAALSWGLAMGLGLMAAGPLYAAFSGGAFLAMSLCSLSALILLFFVRPEASSRT